MVSIFTFSSHQHPVVPGRVLLARMDESLRDLHHAIMADEVSLLGCRRELPVRCVNVRSGPNHLARERRFKDAIMRSVFSAGMKDTRVNHPLAVASVPSVEGSL